MHVGRNNPGLPYSINGMQIDLVTTEKDIGFWITDDLSTTTHVHKARNRKLGSVGYGETLRSLTRKCSVCCTTSGLGHISIMAWRGAHQAHQLSQRYWKQSIQRRLRWFVA